MSNQIPKCKTCNNRGTIPKEIDEKALAKGLPVRNFDLCPDECEAIRNQE